MTNCEQTAQVVRCDYEWTNVPVRNARYASVLTRHLDEYEAHLLEIAGVSG